MDPQNESLEPGILHFYKPSVVPMYNGLLKKLSPHLPSIHSFIYCGGWVLNSVSCMCYTTTISLSTLRKKTICYILSCSFTSFIKVLKKFCWWILNNKEYIKIHVWLLSLWNGTSCRRFPHTLNYHLFLSTLAKMSLSLDL